MTFVDSHRTASHRTASHRTARGPCGSYRPLETIDFVDFLKNAALTYPTFLLRLAPAKRSKKALKKAHSKKLEDGTAAESFGTLLHHMSTITRDLCSQKGDGEGDPSYTFTIDTTPGDKQRRALELLGQISV